jgi:hypothetical protein
MINKFRDKHGSSVKKYSISIRKILRSRLTIHLVALVFFMLLTGLTAIRLGQDVNFDLHNYHYNNPHTLLNSKLENTIAVSGVQSYENPLRDVPAYLFMSNLSPKEAGFAIGALQGINLWLIFEILYVALGFLKVHRLKKLGISFLVALLTLYGSGFNSEVGTTMGDNTTSIFVLLSLLFLLYSVREKRIFLGPDTLRFLSFLSVGVSAGLKLTNIAYLLGIFVAGYFIQTKPRFRPKKILIDIVAVASGVFLAGGLWFLKIWILFKNPIFPFYNGVFKSDYYPVENFVDTRWTNASLWNSLFEPFSYTEHQAISSEIYFRDPRLAAMFSVLAVVMAYVLYRKFMLKRATNQERILTREHKALLIFILISYVAWCVQFSYYRYLIAIELLSLAVITLGIVLLLKKFWLAVAVVTILCTGITLNTIQTSWGRVSWQSTNFGVTKEDFSYMGNSTVLIAGYQPYSFLIPYLPSSSEVIRITSDLSSPAKGTEKMQSLIKDRIETSKLEGKQLYIIVVDEDRVHANRAANELDLQIYNCKELPVIVRHISPNKYRVCDLNRD